MGACVSLLLRSGAANRSVAEEISSDIFAILATEKVLARWHSQRAAKLRTLVCSVARNLIAQRYRTPKMQPLPLDADVAVDSKEEDCFYAAWAEDLLRRSLEAIAAEYRRRGPVGGYCARANILRVVSSRWPVVSTSWE